MSIFAITSRNRKLEIEVFKVVAIVRHCFKRFDSATDGSIDLTTGPAVAF